jgi:hypothetical protein
LFENSRRRLACLMLVDNDKPLILKHTYAQRNVPSYA